MTNNDATLNLATLLTDNRRSSDDFVNATEWAKQFGKDFSYFWKSPEIREFSKALDRKIKREKSAELPTNKTPSCERPGRGKKGDTWVHPLLAIKLAEWLSPEFDLLVKETFKSFIEAPEDFAAEILIKSHNKDKVDRALKRVRVTLGNKKLNELSQKHNRPFHKVHDDRAVGLFGMSTKQLREAGNIQKETPFNYMDEENLSYADAAASMVISADNPDLMALAASKIAQVAFEITGKKLKPVFDTDRLTPNKARAIAYSPEYQHELPVG